MSDDARPAPVQGVNSAYAVLALGGITSFASTMVFPNGVRALSQIALVAPAIVLVAALMALFILVRGGPASFASPCSVLAVAVAAYYGLGAMLPSIAPADYLLLEQEVFAFTLPETVAAHRVTAIGIATLAGVAWAILRLAPMREFRVGKTVDPAYLRRSAMSLLVFGTGVRTLVTMPYMLGAGTGFLSGTVGGLAMLANLGLFFLAFGVARGVLVRGTDRVALLAFGGVNLLFGLLTLSKLNLFFSLGGIIGGIVVGRPRPRVLVVSVIAAIAIYAVVSPFVTVGRTLARDSGSGFSERLAVIPSATALVPEERAQELATWFLLRRFSYVNVTAFAIRSYDQGQPGHSMTAKFLWYFIPRFIWPSKPNVTTTGTEVSILMFGLDDTQTALGIFAEGYWNGGYMMVILSAGFVGLLLALFERARGRALEAFDVPGMYIFWYGCTLIFGIDGFFLPTFVGSWPIILATYIMLRFTLGRAPGSSAIHAPAVHNVPQQVAPGLG